MEHYPLEERSPLNVHRMVEAMKFAFAGRTRISDPNFSDDSQDIEMAEADDDGTEDAGSEDKVSQIRDHTKFAHPF